MKSKINDMQTVLWGMILFYPAVSNYIWNIFNRVVSIIGFSVTPVFFDSFVWGIILILGLPYFLKKIRAKHLIIAFSFWFLILVMYILRLNEGFTFEYLMELCFLVFPFFFLGIFYKESDKEKTFNIMYVLATGVIAISMLYQAYYIFSGRAIATDNMDFAYKLLPSVLIVVARCFYKKINIKGLVIAVASVIFIIAQGTRGPVLCALVFICLMLYKKYKFGKSTVISIVSVALISVLFVNPFVEDKLLNFADDLEDIGLSSRFITKLVEGEIADDNGRDRLYTLVNEEIEKDPLKFRGIYADREILYPIAPNGRGYVHNIVYEFWFDFGVVWGSFLFVFLILLILVGVYKTDYADSYLLMIFIVCGFVHLFLSGTFLENKSFFILLGLLFNSNIKNKRGTINENSTC